MFGASKARQMYSHLQLSLRSTYDHGPLKSLLIGWPLDPFATDWAFSAQGLANQAQLCDPL